MNQYFLYASTHKLVFTAGDVGNVHVMGGRAQIFEFLAGEDIDGNKMDLCVTVLTGLGGGHFDDLARAILDDHEAVLSQGRALHGKGGRGTSIGTLEGMLLMLSNKVSATYFCSTKARRRKADAVDKKAGWRTEGSKVEYSPARRRP